MSTLYAKAAGALLVVLALFFGYRALANHYTDVGRAEIQAKWDADKAGRKKAEDLATAKRLADNAIEKAKQDSVNKTITEKYNAELTQVRNELATAKRLRVGTAICGQGSPSTTKASGAEGSATTDTGGWVLREDVERDFRALELKVEESFATGRACQGFIRENGFAEK